MEVPTFVKDFHDEKEIQKMKYNKLGNTDMMVSHVGIGGCSAGGEYGNVTEQQTMDTIVTALKKGINYIDTSPGYGEGQSEVVIGKALKEVPRKAFYIATKVGRYGGSWKEMFDFSKEKTKASVEKSLERLGVNYIDVVQVHDLEFAPNIDIIINETLPALEELVKVGKVRYIGITGYPLSTLSLVLDLSTVPINTILTYCRNTILDREFFKFRPFFQSKGVGIINASLTGMRLLTSEGPPDWHPASDDIKRAAKEAADLCKSEGVELGKLAVKYSLSSPGVAINILGCDNKDILQQNLDTFYTKLTLAEKTLTQKVQRIFQELPKTHWEGVEIEEYRQALNKPVEKPAR